MGPLKLRATSLQSELGAVEAANSDNGQLGPGAIWNFSPSLKDNRLLPGESSESKLLIFRLSNLRPLTDGKTFRKLMVTFQANLFGKSFE